jgi:hypothetical protein
MRDQISKATTKIPTMMNASTTLAISPTMIPTQVAYFGECDRPFRRS